MGKTRQNKKEGRKSFTLLEVIVSLAIILAALVGPVSLIVFSLSNVSLTTNKLIAYNLAQEGIELVRVIRDNNKHCKGLANPTVPWDRRPDENASGNGGIANRSYVLTYNNIIPLLRPRCVIIYSPDTTQINGNNDILYVNGGRYGSSAIGGAPSIFRRSVQIDFNPTDRITPDDGDVNANRQADFTSTVTWTEKGRAQSVVLKTRIYDWE